MDIKEIRHEIEELLQLVEEWERVGAIAPIESDVALSKLSRLYEDIKFNSHIFLPIANTPIDTTAQLDEGDDLHETMDVNKEEEEANDETISTFAIDLDDVLLMSSSSSLANDEEPKEEIKIEEEVEEEDIEESEEEEVEEEDIEESEEEVVIDTKDEEPEPKEEAPEEEEPEEEEEEEASKEESEPQKEDQAPKDNVLFDIAPLQTRQSRRRSVMMSLYNDSDATIPIVIGTTEPTKSPKLSKANSDATPTTEETLSKREREAEPTIFSDIADTPVVTISDTLTTNFETVADRLSIERSHTIVSDNLAYHSFNELGINERYLIAKDLFGDNTELCSATLEKIEEFDDYDDVMIYIAENFNWSPEIEGTKLLLSILENKFNVR